MNLADILGKMNDFKESRLEEIDRTYSNITEEAANGNQEAKTVLSYGNQKKIKGMINEALNA